jgi:hypothetical protein
MKDNIKIMKHDINFIFSIGYRCYSCNFLTSFNLRKFSGPFDYIFIDFETSLKTINDNFDNFLSDIVVFNKNEQKIELMHNKNTHVIAPNVYELLHNNIGYMAENYNATNVIFNQNYLDDNKLSENLYDWNSICVFHHHCLRDNDVYNLIQKRCDRFKHVISTYNETTALLYITKIVNCSNIIDYMNKIIALKHKYYIHCFIIVIINCDNIYDTHYYNEQDKCLFIIKKVENYEMQRSKCRTDNNVNSENDYKKEYNIILDYFSFTLIEKNDI